MKTKRLRIGYCGGVFMSNETSYGNGFFSIAKGTGLSLALSFLFTVIFAVVLHTTGWGENAVYPINQTMKALSVAFGSLTFVRGEKGWLKGGSVGLLFTAFSYLAFSAIGGDFSLSWLIFIEVAIEFFVGAISGSLAVNLRRA